jgi:hypothetical protein
VKRLKVGAALAAVPLSIAAVVASPPIAHAQAPDTVLAHPSDSDGSDCTYNQNKDANLCDTGPYTDNPTATAVAVGWRGHQAHVHDASIIQVMGWYIVRVKYRGG